MIRLILFATLAFALAPLSQAQNQDSEFREKCDALIAAKGSAKDDERLWQLFDAHWEYQMESLSGVCYLTSGYPSQNGRWSDPLIEGHQRGKATDRLTLKAILSISRAKLTKDNQLNYDLFRRNAEMAVEKQKFPGEFLVLNQMDGLPRDVDARNDAGGKRGRL